MDILREIQRCPASLSDLIVACRTPRCIGNLEDLAVGKVASPDPGRVANGEDPWLPVGVGQQ